MGAFPGRLPRALSSGGLVQQGALSSGGLVQRGALSSGGLGLHLACVSASLISITLLPVWRVVVWSGERALSSVPKVSPCLAGGGPESGIIRRGRLEVELAGGRWRMSDKSKCLKVSMAKA